MEDPNLVQLGAIDIFISEYCSMSLQGSFSLGTVLYRGDCVSRFFSNKMPGALASKLHVITESHDMITETHKTCTKVANCWVHHFPVLFRVTLME